MSLKPNGRTPKCIFIEEHEDRQTAGLCGLCVLLWRRGLRRYGQFCLVGGTGVVVDMGVLWALASPTMLGFNLSMSKVLAAEVAIFNNFLWNDLWTFRRRSAVGNDWRARLGRLMRFNIICVAGIGWSVLLLNLQAYALGVNVYVANLAAIVIVSLWNYFMNLRFGWGEKKPPMESNIGGNKKDLPAA